MEKLLIIGRGRASRHLQHYFRELHVSFDTWSANDKDNITINDISYLESQLVNTKVVILAISDKAIIPFMEIINWPSTITLVHLSGIVYDKRIIGLHPLFPFVNELYPSEVYPTIPFVTDHSVEEIKKLFPWLNNPLVETKPESKNLYHSLCAVASNLPVILWQEVFKEWTSKLHMDESILYPLLQQNMKNVINNSNDALTGALVRKDTETVNKHLETLIGSPLEFLYQSFIKLYEQRKQI